MENLANMVFAVLLLLVVVLVFFVVKDSFRDQGEVVAVVDGHEIFRSEVDARRANLPPLYQEAYGDELLLQQIIDEYLVYQRGVELGVVVSEEEVDEGVRDFEELNSITHDELQGLLELQGIPLSDFRRMVSDQVFLNKVLEVDAFKNVTIPEQDILEFYNNNAESFIVPESVRIRQVLVDDRAVADSLVGSPDLCSEVAEGMDDCWEEDVTWNSGLPEELVEAVFVLGDAEATVVETGFGYHVVQRLGSSDERLMDYRSVAPQIEDFLLRERQKEIYDPYVTWLRGRAVIENRLLDEIIRIAGLNESCFPEDAVLYGASWDSRTQEQLDMLGDFEVNYVECFPDGEEQSIACSSVGVEAYPTWYIEGDYYEGVQSLERLESLGCP